MDKKRAQVYALPIHITNLDFHHRSLSPGDTWVFHSLSRLTVFWARNLPTLNSDVMMP
jgi:hypothetical protein